MNFQKIANDNNNPNNDLYRFYSFLYGVDKNINIIEEDWGNTCGITVSNVFEGNQNDSICFNFYEDGKFRCLISTSEECTRKIFDKALNKKLRYISFWELFKMWLYAK